VENQSTDGYTSCSHNVLQLFKSLHATALFSEQLRA